MNYSHFLMFGKQQTVVYTVQQEHNQQHLPVPLTDLPSLVPLTRYTTRTAPVFAARNSQICDTSNVDSATTNVTRQKKSACKYHTIIQSAKKTCAMLETVPGYYSKRGQCSRPSLVTTTTCTELETVPGY